MYSDYDAPRRFNLMFVVCSDRQIKLLPDGYAVSVVDCAFNLSMPAIPY